MRINAEEVLLLVVDVQEQLKPYISGYKKIAARIARVIQGATILDVPILVNEQYKKGLGDTVAELQPLLVGCPHFEKFTFSGCDDEATLQAIRQQNKKYIILCGVETHVCVMQTALSLLSEGYTPVIVCDAVGSRYNIDRKIALKRLTQAGAILATSESILFELCRSSKAPAFKPLLALIK